MLRLRTIACGVLVASVVRAHSAAVEMPLSSAIPSAPSTFTAPTVADFLNACSRNHTGCADEVGAALMDKMTLNGTADICLPSTDYTAAVLEWLNAHPETHGMLTEDGIYLSLKTIYRCGG